MKAMLRLYQGFIKAPIASFAHAYSVIRLYSGPINIKAPIASFTEELAHVFGEVSTRKIQAHNRMWQRVPLCTYMGLVIYMYWYIYI